MKQQLLFFCLKTIKAPTLVGRLIVIAMLHSVVILYSVAIRHIMVGRFIIVLAPSRMVARPLSRIIHHPTMVGRFIIVMGELLRLVLMLFSQVTRHPLIMVGRFIIVMEPSRLVVASLLRIIHHPTMVGRFITQVLMQSSHLLMIQYSLLKITKQMVWKMIFIMKMEPLIFWVRLLQIFI